MVQFTSLIKNCLYTQLHLDKFTTLRSRSCSLCLSVRPSFRPSARPPIRPYIFHLLPNWALQLFPSVHSGRKKAKPKHLADAAPYLSCSSNLLWAAGVEAEELPLSREVNLQPFQFHPMRFQSPSAWTSSRPGQRCHLLFISSVIRQPEKVLYIVMLPHLCDIRKIEVPVKDQYELKVNKSKKSVRIRSCNRLFFVVHLFLQQNLKWCPFGLITAISCISEHFLSL